MLHMSPCDRIDEVLGVVNRLVYKASGYKIWQVKVRTPHIIMYRDMVATDQSAPLPLTKGLAGI